MGFVQLIEFRTADLAKFNRALDKWLADTAERTAVQRGTLCEDRESRGLYVQVVEFPSYEEAMANSADPRTTEFAEELALLCTEGPTFRNLDVVWVEQR